MAITSKVGGHISIAGGINLAPQRAFDQGCETFQCFSRSPQGGPAPKLTPELLENFKSSMKQCGIENFYIHAPYYINLASMEPKTQASSIKVLREELERGSLLGARYLMAHVGSYASQTLEEGLNKVSQGILKILDGYKGSTQFLIEISAGAGSVIGDRFDEISEIFKKIGLPIGPKAKDKSIPGFGGVCFDTCHAFGAGYDFRTLESLKEVLAEFDQKIGLHYLKLTHVNDSKTELGGKRDRHEHIGDGFIGKEGIATILTSEPFSKIDWLLETEESGRPKDIEILKNIRKNATI